MPSAAFLYTINYIAHMPFRMRVTQSHGNKMLVVTISECNNVK